MDRRKTGALKLRLSPLFFGVKAANVADKGRNCGTDTQTHTHTHLNVMNSCGDKSFISKSFSVSIVQSDTPKFIFFKIKFLQSNLVL